MRTAASGVAGKEQAMYGDTSVIRGLARAMRERADAIRAEADALAARADGVPWTGRAAEAMRWAARDHTGRLRACAAAHDAAADALDHHARDVDHVKGVISGIEDGAMHLLHSAASEVAGMAGSVIPDGVGHWVARFDPPSSGSIAWLDVHLPGAA
jgi:hypothetical protein